MPSVRIEQADLDYYESLERATFALQYFLTDCRCSKFCDHKFMLRRMVDEIATKIQDHRTHNAVQVLSAPDKQGDRKVLTAAENAFINHGTEYP